MKFSGKRPAALLLITLLLMLSFTLAGCNGRESDDGETESANVSEGNAEDEEETAAADEEAQDAETAAEDEIATNVDDAPETDNDGETTDTVAEEASPETEPAAEAENAEETAAADADSTYTPSFISSSCDFIVPGGRDVTCGYLTVPEDRSQPDGREIRLHVAVFTSESGNPAPDPIVYLEGGPGGEPLETLVFTFEDFFAPYLAERDVIIFDQRGTGLSEPSLACPELVDASIEYLDDVLSDEEEAEIYLTAMSACRERLATDGINFTAYNSRENAADLNDLRIALGYDEWELVRDLLRH
jgi:hypothetical protein